MTTQLKTKNNKNSNNDPKQENIVVAFWKNFWTRNKGSILWNSLRVFVIFFLLVVVTFIVALIFQINPISYYRDIFRGSLSSPATLLDTVGFAGISIFIALAFAIPYRAKFFNIGIAGQMMVAGAFTYMLVKMIFAKWNYGVAYSPSIFGSKALLPVNGLHHFVELIFVIFSCVFFAVIWATIPGLMKAYFKANEVVSTIMLNWIALALYHYILVTSPFGFFNTNSAASYPLSPNAAFRFEGVSGAVYGSIALGFFTFAVLFAIAAVYMLKTFLNKTVSGYSMELAQYGKNLTRYAGANYEYAIVKSTIIAGVCAGFAACFYYFGIYQSLSNISAPIDYGFLAIAISLIAKNNPVGIIFSSIVFGILLAGQPYSESGNSGASYSFSNVIFGIIIFCVIAEVLLFNWWFKKWKYNLPNKNKFKALGKELSKNTKHFFAFNKLKNKNHKNKIKNNKSVNLSNKNNLNKSKKDSVSVQKNFSIANKGVKNK